MCSSSKAAGELAPIFLPLLFSKIFYPFHHLKKYWKKNGIEEAIHKDSGHMNASICTYNARPGKKTLKYIRKLNLPAAQKIKCLLAESKKK